MLRQRQHEPPKKSERTPRSQTPATLAPEAAQTLAGGGTKPMFTIQAQEGLARAGVLLTRHGGIATPAALVYTRRGGCLHLTPDMLERLRPHGAQALQINAMQFLEQPSPDTLRAHGGGVAAYAGTPEWPVVVSNRDAVLNEYLGTKPSNANAAYVHTHTGGRRVSPELYMDVINALRPDVYVALADEVGADAGDKRVGQSVDRTAAWLDACLRLQAEQQQKQQQQRAAAATARGSADDEAPPAVLAPVVGGASVEQRARSAAAAAARPGVAGFALCGFGTGEDPELQRPALLAAAVEHLPPEKPRLLVGMASPDEALDAIAAGADLLDCAYPTAATAGGYALSFPLAPPGLLAGVEGEEGVGGGAEVVADADGVDADGADDVDADAGADGGKLNLWSLRYRLDARPLVRGCQCFACAQGHSRAYVHHLLHTHEMLAQVLLDAHNTARWLRFLDAARGAVRVGKLGELRAWHAARRRRAAERAAGEAAADAAAPAE